MQKAPVKTRNTNNAYSGIETGSRFKGANYSFAGTAGIGQDKTASTARWACRNPLTGDYEPLMADKLPPKVPLGAGIPERPGPLEADLDCCKSS